MEKRFARGLMGVGIVLFIVACSGSITSELFIRDLIDIGANPSTVYFTTATIEMESPGEDSLEQLKLKMKEWFREAQNFRQITRDYSTFLVADIKIPVHSRSQMKVDTTRDLLSLVLETSKEGNIDFGFRFDQGMFEQISSYVKDEFWTSVSIQDWTFSIVLKNDTRDSQRVVLQTVYANQQPVLFPEEFTLRARDSITINFADVLRDYAYKEGEVLFGTLLQ